MNAKRGLPFDLAQGREPVERRIADGDERRRPATRFHFFLHPSAFTLIEMLTVIAIIGILAGILLPTLGMVRAKARAATASSDISALAQALAAYSADFGALPPDSNDCLPNGAGEAFEDLDMPNEILVWFLTRQYVKTGGAGYPNPSGTEWTVSPQDSLKINARITAAGSPYFDVRTKARRDYDNDGFNEFVDPWGRPYMYRAYPRPARSIDNIQAPVYDAGEDITTMTFELDVLAERQPMEGVRGKVTFSGFEAADDSFNGTFDFEGNGDFSVNIFLRGNVAAPSLTGSPEYRFALHNTQTCDLYSLGPDGLTRGAQEPEWKPGTSDTEYGRWTEVWGSPGDGNDVLTEGGNIGITDEKHRDDINNW